VYESVLHCAGLGTELKASRSLLYTCHPGPDGGAWGCSAKKYWLTADLPIAPAIAVNQDGWIVTSVPITGIGWPNCCSSARYVALVCGEVSV
jgi:hypothetical protein